MTKNAEVQNALRGLYEHPDKVELYPGIFCESDEFMGLDPGPKQMSSALWTAIFSDAITLGMNEVTPDNEICKSSVFHRLIQRAFPGWFQYNSVRFFHPFYTAKTNEKFAKAQGYSSDFRLIPEPAKPVKPVHLTDFESTALVLKDSHSNFMHPALLHSSALPRQLKEVLQPNYRKSAFTTVPDDQSPESEPALHANIDCANQWDITRALFGKTPDNLMTELGFHVAQKVLEHESDVGKAAAILLLVSLDFAYNAVVSFTAVVDRLMSDLYEAAHHPHSSWGQQPTWLKVQELAFGDDKEDPSHLEDLIEIVQRLARATVRLPFVRVAKVGRTYKTARGVSWSVDTNQTVIPNIQQATIEAEKSNQTLEAEYLTSQQSFDGRFDAYQPRRFATLALTSMVRFIAQMKNPRRGHNAQGKLKKIHLDWTAEGYSNFMAPMTMEWIRQQVEHLPEGDLDKCLFSLEVLKPETDTYSTPSWDEMVQFPMTWKIRFDGFGKSDYSLNTKPPQPYGKIKSAWLPDYAPPWYQPQGLSHTGGTFADPVCSCATPGTSVKGGEASKRNAEPDAAEREPTLSTGCGLYVNS